MSQRSVLEIHETNVVFWSVYEKCLTETDVSENQSVFFSEEPCSSVASLAGGPPLSCKMVHFLFKN